MKDRIYTTRNDLELEGLGFTNARNKYDKGKILELARSLKKEGFLKDLLVWKTEDPNGNRSIVVDGGRRITALDLLISNGEAGELENQIPIVLYKGSLIDAKKAALQAELHHEPWTQFELSKEIFDLIENHEQTQKDLAELLNVSQPYVSIAYTTFKKASNEILSAWQKYNIPMDLIREVNKLPENKQIDAIKELISAASSGRKAAGAIRSKIKNSNSNMNPRASAKQITELLVLGDGAASPYVKGMMDMAKFANGLIGVAEFDQEWDNFISSNNKIISMKDE